MNACLLYKNCGFNDIVVIFNLHQIPGNALNVAILHQMPDKV